MRKDLYPFSVTPCDAAPRARAMRMFTATSKGLVFVRAAAPVREPEAVVAPSRGQHASSVVSAPRGGAARR